MFDKLQQLGINFEEKSEILKQFIDLFLDYNQKINLISKNDADAFFEKHIYDSLSFNLFYQKYYKNEKIKLLDIGTGGGLPSIPIAIFFNNIEVTAVDSTYKKIKFIEYISDKLKLSNLHTLCKRIEELDKSKKYDVCTSRAMAEFRIISEYAIPYINEGGFFIAYKSIKADTEINNAKNTLKILKSEIIDKINYSLPICQQNKRVLIITRKNNKISNLYPRKHSLIIKKPL